MYDTYFIFYQLSEAKNQCFSCGFVSDLFVNIVTHQGNKPKQKPIKYLKQAK